MTQELRVHFDDPARVAFEIIEDGIAPVVAELSRANAEKIAWRILDSSRGQMQARASASVPAAVVSGMSEMARSILRRSDPDAAA